MSANPQYPQRHLISAEEYLRMAAAGVFSSEARLELMDGEIIEMAPIGSPHAAVVNTLTKLFVNAVGDRGIVSVQNPVVIGERSVPQPDLLVLRAREDRYFSAHPTAVDVVLIVEVSDITLRFDLNKKVPAYAKAEIAEAWVVDLENRAVHRFSAPSNGEYLYHTVLSAAGTIAPAAMLDLEVCIADLFPLP